jgi:hypothetical protein
MAEDIAGYFDSIGPEWQAEICRNLDERIRRAIPDVSARLQYGKPHYLKNGKYACVLATAKGWVTFTIFNATALDAPEGLFEPGPPERRTVKIRQGQAVDYDQLGALLQQAASTI